MSNDAAVNEMMERAQLLLDAQLYFIDNGKTKVKMSQISKLVDECNGDIEAAYELYRKRTAKRILMCGGVNTL